MEEYNRDDYPIEYHMGVFFYQKSRMILFNGATKAPIARYYRVSLHQTAYHDCVSAMIVFHIIKCVDQSNPLFRH